MKRVYALHVLLLVTVSFVKAQKKADIIIEGAVIVDVQSGKLMRNKIIIINKGRISAITSQRNACTAVRVIHAKDKFIIPGLWDMHMHFGGGDTLINENKDLLPLFIANGVTTVRDCAADLSAHVLQWRREIAENRLTGPTIFTAGPKLEGYKSIWIGDLEIGTKEELQAALDSLQKLKVDFVKITDNTMNPDLYMESVRQAVKRGWKITGHIPSALTLAQVSDAGLSAIEHISYLLRAGNKEEALYAKKIAAGEITVKEYNQLLLANFDTARAVAVYKHLSKNKTAVVPTLSISLTTAYLDKENHANDTCLQYIGKGLKNTYNWRVERAAKDDAAAISFRHELIERAAGLFPLLNKAGVTIIAGTDAGYLNSFDYPGFSLHKELEYMVKYGLTPLQALQASVINGPAFFNKLQDYGSVTTGKMADLLILDENPLENITATQKINAVITKGKLFDRKQLNLLLEEVKRNVAEAK